MITYGDSAVHQDQESVRERELSQKIPNGTDCPLITVGMPTLNRVMYLEASLEGLYRADYPKTRLRLVFVDGYSSDGAYELLTKFAETHRSEYRDIFVIQEHGNIPHARNVCIKHLGEADYLVFVDSDVTPPPDFLNRLLRLSKSSDIACIAYSNFAYEPSRRKVKKVSMVGMGCTLIRKEVLSNVGPFDERLRIKEDCDYCLRAKRCRILLDTTEFAYHPDDGRYTKETILKSSFKDRRLNAIICRRRVYRERFALYAGLDLACALGMIVSPFFFAAPIVYFLGQLIRRRDLKVATYLTVNSLIIVPLTLLGMVELALE
ncbi:MAG TPA: glycosyltransferase [Candidatus Acidoferrum sp.]|nr:glycosyltransferase [Candidatus Acidoferrum sp.]